MKIICTKKEKEAVINAFMDSEYCFHPDNNESCVYDSGCYECIEASIEWQIEDGEQDA